MSLKTQLTVFLSLASLSFAKIYDSFQEVPTDTFDFVVIGGGAGGLVVANRLSENPNVTVLVIEAGVSDKDALTLQVPFFWPNAQATPFDWNYTTTAQQGLNGRTIPYSRGHVIGGSTSINALIYNRLAAEEWDRLAKETGDAGWSWKNMKQYFLKNEILTPPADGHDTTGQINPAVHGKSGVNGDSLPGFSTPIDSKIIQTTKELSKEFPYNLDMNDGSPLGVGWCLATIRDGARSSASTSYLAPKYADRPNLYVALNTRVTRVLANAPATPLQLQNVELTSSAAGPRTQVTARKEVVLAAGSIGSAQILLNSGIGDASALRPLGVDPILVDNPSVGANLSDHAMVHNAWFVNSTDTWESLLRDPSIFNDDLEEWMTSRTGPLVVTSPNTLTFLRLAKDSPILKQFPDPVPGSQTPHIEFLIGNGFGGSPLPETGNFMTISTAVVSPTARGSLRLNSNDPFDSPIINPNLLGTDFDIAVMKEAIKSARRFVSAPVWSDYVLGPFINITTDAELEQYIRNNATTVWHPVGTAAMTAKSAPFGVVDPDLSVKGVQGLRVIDASVFPHVPAGHPQVPVYVIAERGSDLIKKKWGL
ncbi:aryl-alcohol oxidase [Moniliophthora roreri MCA 2997]|uniref:Aryl-alcohol oxidase n=1 Tax=Moniliophthora roreri (strain MCA 2997) TaxID=1381753 RepID=V2XV74_MONRO|nr:aryl-alcohol oxidase [Moniliophthora roreri MCA 2997]